MSGLRVRAAVGGSFKQIMATRTDNSAKAVTDSVKASTQLVKQNWQGQLRGAGLSSRVANAVQAQTYPKTGNSLGAAGEVYIAKGSPRALVAELENSATITAAGRRFLAVPTENVPKGSGGKKLAPNELQAMTGFKLRFAQNRRGTKMLVADTAASSGKRGGVRPATRGKTRGGRKAQTTVLYILTPQVTIKKRLNLQKEAERIGGELAQQIAERLA